MERLVFSHHCQVNEETGNRRPVMLTVQRVPRLPKPSKTGGAADSEREEGEKTKPEETQTEGNWGAWLGNGKRLVDYSS
jgi:E3 ubiquitin-protein ligase HUWE1